MDNNTIIDHAFFKGLYLVILDRKTLNVTFNATYDTVTRGSTETILGEDKRWYEEKWVVDNFGDINAVEFGSEEEGNLG